jgi:hypothetical protein
MEQILSPIVDCIGDEEYCGVDEDFEDKPIDDAGHYKFKDLPGGIAVFIMKFNGVEIKMAYDLSEYETSDIADFIKVVATHGPEKANITIHPGSNQDSSIIYDNGKIIFSFTGMGNSYTSYNITVPSASVVNALKRLI